MKRWLSHPFVVNALWVGGILVVFALVKSVPAPWSLPVAIGCLVVGFAVASRRRKRWIELRDRLRELDPSSAPRDPAPVGPLAQVLIALGPSLLLALAIVWTAMPGDHMLLGLLLIVLVFALQLIAGNVAESAPNGSTLAAMAAEVEVQEALHRARSGSEAPTLIDTTGESAAVARVADAVALSGDDSPVARRLADYAANVLDELPEVG